MEPTHSNADAARPLRSRRGRRLRRIAAGACLASALGAAAGVRAVPAAASAGGEKPNVLLITVDTLRPDALGWTGGRNPTPAIDRLAAEGFRFRGAVSPVPLTLPSHASILTGLLPRRHGVRDNGQILASATPTLARTLKARGYATAAFVSGYPLRRLFGLDSGFDVYDDRLTKGSEGWLERPAGATTAAALAWAARARAPWFLWIHYYDPHDPYEPPRAFRRPGPRGAYDGEVAYVDSEIGRLLRGLRATPAGRVTVFAGDHGEALGEHGEAGHGFFIYDSTILVPLIFHAPGRVAPAQSAAPVRLIDVAPTLLDLLGLAPLPDADGRTIAPLLRGKAFEPPAAYVETQQPWIAYGWAPLFAIRDGRWKLIRAPRPELYEWAVDPSEQRNVAAEPQKRETALALGRALSAVEAKPAADSRRTNDPEALARLRSLGYLGAGASGPAMPRNLPDPKDRLAERTMLLQGEELLREGQLDRAIAKFSDVLRRDPGNRFALLRSGIALLKKGDLAGSVRPLEEAVRLDPDQAENRFALADALTRTGQYRRAVPHWMEAVRLSPRRVAAWSNLGTALGRDGRMTEAVSAFARAVELDPRDPLLVENLAFAERAAGQDAAALAHLRKAASLGPPARFPYSATVGLLLIKTGEPGEAARWLRASRRGEIDYADGRFELAVIDVYAGNKASARENLRAALEAQPKLRPRAESHPALSSLLK
ncbi:MAG: sulfatase-like hydrolase/transferase [Acidobacteriota bacterium]